MGNWGAEQICRAEMFSTVWALAVLNVEFISHVGAIIRAWRAIRVPRENPAREREKESCKDELVGPTLKPCWRKSTPLPSQSLGWVLSPFLLLFNFSVKHNPFALHIHLFRPNQELGFGIFISYIGIRTVLLMPKSGCKGPNYQRPEERECVCVGREKNDQTAEI